MVVHFEHVVLGLFLGPAEDPLEDVGDVVHEVDGVVPANDGIARI